MEEKQEARSAIVFVSVHLGIAVINVRREIDARMGRMELSASMEE